MQAGPKEDEGEALSGGSLCQGEAELRGPAVARAVIGRLKEHGDAEGVGKQDPFLAPVGAHLAGGGQKIDRLPPFFDGSLDLPVEARPFLRRGRSAARYQRSRAARSEPRVPTQRSPPGVDSFFQNGAFVLRKSMMYSHASNASPR